MEWPSNSQSTRAGAISDGAEACGRRDPGVEPVEERGDVDAPVFMDGIRV